MDRLNRYNYYLDIAKAASMRSTCLRKAYGAVLVKNDCIIATGYNGVPAKEAHCTICTKLACDKDVAEYTSCKSVHAEMNALLMASKDDMLGADLYLAGYDAVTGEENINARPCEICLRLIKNAGINRIINRTGIIYERHKDGIMREVDK